jgi:hypothetical protein
MIIVHETWCLKPEYVHDALRVMQKMDDLVGLDAHRHPGWCGHASFYRRTPTEILMLYPWRSIPLHEDIAQKEIATLAEFQAQYCAKPRRIEYLEEMPVEVEGHDHEHHHSHAGESHHEH